MVGHGRMERRKEKILRLRLLMFGISSRTSSWWLGLDRIMENRQWGFSWFWRLSICQRHQEGVQATLAFGHSTSKKVEESVLQVKRIMIYVFYFANIYLLTQIKINQNINKLQWSWPPELTILAPILAQVLSIMSTKSNNTWLPEKIRCLWFSNREAITRKDKHVLMLFTEHNIIHLLCLKLVLRCGRPLRRIRFTPRNMRRWITWNSHGKYLLLKKLSDKDSQK